MYCDMTEEDKKKVECWLKWVDKVVVFVRTSLYIYFYTASHIKSILQMGLFSTVVAALLTVTVPDLKPNPQDMPTFYLNSLYNLQVQVLKDSNVSRPFIPAQPPPFSAPKYAILVNALLFVSLLFNIFTAILALLLRESVPQYLLVTESRRISPLYRARIHEIVASELYHSRAFWALRVMVHLSAWCFFVGLFIYLFHTNQAVFSVFLCCSCLCFIASFIVGHWLGKASES
jgi:Family of unknown function (DUF6535)